MKRCDVAGFFADQRTLDGDEYLTLDYYFECVGTRKSQRLISGSEQSTAQWQRVGIARISGRVRSQGR